MRPSTFYEPAWVSRWDRLFRDLRHEPPRFSMSDLQEEPGETSEDREHDVEIVPRTRLRW